MLLSLCACPPLARGPCPPCHPEEALLAPTGLGLQHLHWHWDPRSCPAALGSQQVIKGSGCADGFCPKLTEQPGSGVQLCAPVQSAMDRHIQGVVVVLPPTFPQAGSLGLGLPRGVQQPRRPGLLLAQPPRPRQLEGKAQAGLVNLITATEPFTPINLRREIRHGRQVTAEGAWWRQG